MRVSAFTFLRNADMLDFPFIESIKSALPLCDEYIVNVGDGEDDTLELIRSLRSPKIRVIRSQWNENMKTRGFVYAQQTNIALANCTGDWALYLQGDEVLHEDDIPVIREAMRKHLDNPEVEGLLLDYIHFYGNHNTFAWSPAWYRREARVIRNDVRAVFPSDGQFFVVLTTNRKARYPRAVVTGARVFHYGWVRREEKMLEKLKRVGKYWGHDHTKIDYSEIDPQVLTEFTGTHPAVMKGWFPDVSGPFTPNHEHVLTSKEKRHRIAAWLERLSGRDLSKKHYKIVWPKPPKSPKDA